MIIASLIIIITTIFVGLGIFLSQKTKPKHEHNWEIVECGDAEKAALVYCSTCGEFSIRT